VNVLIITTFFILKEWKQCEFCLHKNISISLPQTRQLKILEKEAYGLTEQERIVQQEN
jgi:hypothetical protein